MIKNIFQIFQCNLIKYIFKDSISKISLSLLFLQMKLPALHILRIIKTRSKLTPRACKKKCKSEAVLSFLKIINLAPIQYNYLTQICLLNMLKLGIDVMKVAYLYLLIILNPIRSIENSSYFANLFCLFQFVISD